MRTLAALAAMLAALLPTGEASAQRAPGPAAGLARGVGCYWHRGRHYCNRYCYKEVDGYWFCQLRLRDATSQAPWHVDADPPPRRRGKPSP